MIATGAFLSALGVMAGAFGAHGLQKATTDETILHGFQTGTQYQLWHALALLLTGVLYGGNLNRKFLRWAGWCFGLGILFFSGSLYLLTWLKLEGSGMTRAVGPVTPLGGVFFIAGWLLLGASALKKERS